MSEATSSIGDSVEHVSLGVAMAKAAGISYPAAICVVPMLIPCLSEARLYNQMVDLVDHGVETIDGTACHVIEGVLNKLQYSGNVRLWIDEDYMIRRIRECSHTGLSSPGLPESQIVHISILPLLGPKRKT
jgi:hypothetical protein